MRLGHKYGTVSEQDFKEHEKRKEESRQKKKNDKSEGEGNDNIMVLAMDLQVVLLAPQEMQITTKPSFAVMTLQSTTCLTVMSCATSGMR